MALEARPSQTLNHLLDFSIFPGQQLFTGKCYDHPVELPIECGHVSEADLNRTHLKHYFNTFPLAAHMPNLVRRLEEEGFRLEDNGDTPSSFTIVHLVAESELLIASVMLAEDEDEDEDLQALRGQGRADAAQTADGGRRAGVGRPPKVLTSWTNRY
jgi:hypothetical protein